MFRECCASGADSQTISNAGPHAKYAVFTWARAPGDTVAMAQSFDWSKRRRVVAARRLAGGCLAVRRTGIESTTRPRALGFRSGAHAFVTRGTLARRDP